MGAMVPTMRKYSQRKEQATTTHEPSMHDPGKNVIEAKTMRTAERALRAGNE